MTDGGDRVSEEPSVWSRRSILTGAGLAFVAAVLAGWGVARLQRAERELASEPRTAAFEGTLVGGALDEGDWVRFEVCFDRAVGEAWDGLEFEVSHVDAGAAVFERRLSEATTLDDFGCRLLGQSSGTGLPISGEYALRAQWSKPPPVSEATYVGRMIARRPMGAMSRVAPWAMAFASVLIVIGLAGRGGWSRDTPRPEGRPLLRALLSLLAVASAMFILPQLLPPTSVAVLGQGLAFVGLQVALASLSGVFLHSKSGPRLADSRRWLWVLLAGPVIGVVLVVLGNLVGGWMPVRDVAPIHAFLARPSGTAAAAFVGLVAPIAEESFFRGHLFRLVAARGGNAVAWLSTTVAFALLHLPQHWQAWDAFAAVVVTGAGLGALRWWTGSFLPGVTAHLCHNALLVLPRLLS